MCATCICPGLFGTGTYVLRCSDNVGLCEDLSVVYHRLCDVKHCSPVTTIGLHVYGTGIDFV